MDKILEYMRSVIVSQCRDLGLSAGLYVMKF
jgi:hypothetical protein